jgi:hypothetical protein
VFVTEIAVCARPPAVPPAVLPGLRPGSTPALTVRLPCRNGAEGKATYGLEGVGNETTAATTPPGAGDRGGGGDDRGRRGNAAGTGLGGSASSVRPAAGQRDRDAAGPDAQHALRLRPHPTAIHDESNVNPANNGATETAAPAAQPGNHAANHQRVLFDTAGDPKQHALSPDPAAIHNESDVNPADNGATETAALGAQPGRPRGDRVMGVLGWHPGELLQNGASRDR